MTKIKKFWYCGNCDLDRDNDKSKPCNKCKHWTINEGEHEVDDIPNMFYCNKCDEETNQKTTTTCCVKCYTPLTRTGVLPSKNLRKN